MSPRPAAQPGQTAGERWAREELRRLAAARYRPAAIAGFLVASQRRAADVRRTRPALARQARAWELVGAVAYVAAERRPRALAGRLAWWAAVSVMLDWHLGMVEHEDGAPTPLHVPDALTLGRAWLVPAIAAGPALGPLLAAGVSDVLDGRAARATRTTRAGRDLEGLVDACVLVAALRAGRRAGAVSRGPAWLEVARQAAGAGYALAAYFGAGRPPSAEVTLAARASTPVRFLALAAVARGHRRSADVLLTAGSLAGIVGFNAASRRLRDTNLQASSPAGSARDTRTRIARSARCA